MKKKKPSFGYHFEVCPICGYKYFEYFSESMWGWGTVEQHGNCDRCGYLVEQAYSGVVEAFADNFRGWKDYYGNYHPKDVKKHRRARRKADTRNIPVNPWWIKYM